MDNITPPPMPCSVAHIFVGDDSEDVFSFTKVEERDQQWLAIVKEAVLAEREACAYVCEAERRLGVDDERAYYGDLMAAAIRSRSTT